MIKLLEYFKPKEEKAPEEIKENQKYAIFVKKFAHGEEFVMPLFDVHQEGDRDPDFVQDGQTIDVARFDNLEEAKECLHEHMGGCIVPRGKEGIGMIVPVDKGDNVYRASGGGVRVGSPVYAVFSENYVEVREDERGFHLGEWLGLLNTSNSNPEHWKSEERIKEEDRRRNFKDLGFKEVKLEMRVFKYNWDSKKGVSDEHEVPWVERQAEVIKKYFGRGGALTNGLKRVSMEDKLDRMDYEVKMEFQAEEESGRIGLEQIAAILSDEFFDSVTIHAVKFPVENGYRVTPTCRYQLTSEHKNSS